MASKELINAVNGFENYISRSGIDEVVVDEYVKATHVALIEEKDIEYGLKVSSRAKEVLNNFVVRETGGHDVWAVERFQQDNKTDTVEYVEKYYELLKWESYYLFESFIYYMEKKRHYSKRFYHPRRKTLKIVVDDLQSLEDNPMKFQGVSLPSRTGKSTVCILFLGWIAMKRPNSHSAMGGHSGILAKGFYKELLNMMTTEEYTFQELYEFWNPKYIGKAFPTDKSADEFTITLGDPDRFATVTCRGIDGTWTGAVDVSKDGYLYVDDLIRDRQHSLSPTRMEETFQEYLNKMVDRKNDGAKELMVGTLWNVLDPLERIRKQYENNPLYRFRKIPALNEDDESNFDYENNGFSTEYYHNMRERLDKAEWEAKFMQRPFVREGLLFQTDELRYFDGLVPDERHRVVAACDPAFGGGDSLSMPICDDYGDNQKYIIDWIFNKGTQGVTVPLIVDKIVEHYITLLRIEKNNGGLLLADSIKVEMAKRGVNHCKIELVSAPNKISKEDKISGYSDYVKRNFVFLRHNREMPTDELPRYRRSDEYNKAIDEMCMYSPEGKNPHDDAADSITQLAMMMETKRREVRIMQGLL